MATMATVAVVVVAAVAVVAVAVAVAVVATAAVILAKKLPQWVARFCCIAFLAASVTKNLPASSRPARFLKPGRSARF
jgi:hypothetical protein